MSGEVTVFSGHRVDAPSRAVPRFPAHLAPAARAAIQQRLQSGMAVSSAANGGDILFLEACLAQNITPYIVLPFAADDFIQQSVATKAEGNWEDRFRHIWAATPQSHRHILRAAPKQNPYSACNAAMLKLACKLAPTRRLIALWDGQAGDGIGGTSEMVAMAQQAGFAIEIIDTGLLRGEQA